eukprot:Skav206211  [mRNA]  locus=scaffold1844:473933:483971:- [translate_table: standard]
MARNVAEEELAKATAMESWVCHGSVVVVVVMVIEETLQDDRGLVLAAVAADGLALRWASPRLRADRAVAFVAVRQRGSALEFCGVLQNDEEPLGEEGMEAGVVVGWKALTITVLEPDYNEDAAGRPGIARAHPGLAPPGAEALRFGGGTDQLCIGSLGGPAGKGVA